MIKDICMGQLGSDHQDGYTRLSGSSEAMRERERERENVQRVCV